MKKTLTILSAAFLFLISFNAKAQDDKQYVKSYITLFGGLSLPSSDFGKSIYADDKAGYAKRGVTFGLDGAWYVYKNLAVAASVSFQDQGELNTNDAQSLSNGYNTSYDRDETTVSAVDRYHNYFILLGPQYSFTVKKFIIDLRAQAGVLKSASTPSITADMDPSSSTSVEIVQNSGGGKVFAYGGAVGLRWSFSDNWDLGLRASYVDSDGPHISSTINSGNFVGREVTRQPITVLQTTLGITVHL